MEQVRYGLIGYGKIGSQHVGKILEGKVPPLRLCAIADTDPERLAAARALLGEDMKLYDSADALITSGEAQAVHICTPHYDHPTIAIKALNAGLHTLVEKPAGVYTRQVREMNAVAAAHPELKFAMDFNQRTDPVYIKTRELVQSGAIGQIRHTHWLITNWYRSQSYYDQGGWRATWKGEGGGVLINQAIHTFDLLRWLAGEEIVDVRCSMSAKRLDKSIEVEDTVDMLLTTAGGARFVFYASNCSVGNTPVSMVIKCERGEMQLRGNVLTIKSPEGETTEDYTSGVAYGKDYWGSGHGFLIEDFYKRLQEGRPAFILPEDALKTTILTEMAYTNSWPQRRRDA